MKINILIPVHNNIEETKHCLNCLRQQSFNNYSIYLINDGSTDGTKECVERDYPEVIQLIGDGNLWWTGAINLALNEYIHNWHDDDFVLTLNNDVDFDKNYLENLIIASKKKPNTLIGSVSLDNKDESIVVDAGVKINWKTGYRTNGKFVKGDFFNDNISVLSGRGLLMPISIINKIGFFDEKNFPQYGGDSEFSVRALKNGFKLAVYYNAILYVDQQISGFKFTPFMKVGLKDAYKLLFSIKSTANIRTRSNYVKYICPRKYWFRNYIRFLFSCFMILTSIVPFYFIKRIFYPFRKVYLQYNNKKND